MNKQQRDEFLKWVKDDIGESVKNAVDNIMLPAFASEPYVNWADGEAGLYISVVEEDDAEEYAQVLPWKKLVDGLMQNDFDLIERYYPLVKDLAERMRKHIEEE